MKLYLILVFLILFSATNPQVALADNAKPLSGSVSDPFVEAQEKLMYAKGSYKTVKQQEQALRDLKKATRLSLRASKLRAKAEKLQGKADALINKANQHAVSRGLYITNPMAQVMMQPPPIAEKAAKAPVPGQAINIIVPKQEEVSYEENSNDDYPSSSPTLNNF